MGLAHRKFLLSSHFNTANPNSKVSVIIIIIIHVFLAPLETFRFQLNICQQPHIRVDPLRGSVPVGSVHTAINLYYHCPTFFCLFFFLCFLFLRLQVRIELQDYGDMPTDLGRG